MALSDNLNALIEQLNNELKALDRELSETIELIRERINRFPENLLILIQLFATINNYVLFAKNTRRRLKETFQYLTSDADLPERDLQEAGKDLSEQLGRILEAKIIVNQIKRRLED